MLEENILRELDQFYTDNPIKVWIPSLQSEQDFRPISVGEQRSLIELENTPGNELNLNYLVEGPKILNELIRSTCINKDIYDNLTIVDRPAILLQLKYHTKETVVMYVDDEVVEINLQPYVQKLHEKKTRDLRSLSKITVSNFIIETHIPTLDIDEFYNSYFLSLYKERNAVNMDEAAGDAFFAELAKFIKTITFETHSGAEVFDFTDLSKNSFIKNIQFLENTPSNVITEITSYISHIKEYQARLITEKISVNKEDKNVMLDIDIPFFTTL